MCMCVCVCICQCVCVLVYVWMLTCMCVSVCVCCPHDYIVLHPLTSISIIIYPYSNVYLLFVPIAPYHQIPMLIIIYAHYYNTIDYMTGLGRKALMPTPSRNQLFQVSSFMNFCIYTREYNMRAYY